MQATIIHYDELTRCGLLRDESGQTRFFRRDELPENVAVAARRTVVLEPDAGAAPPPADEPPPRPAPGPVARSNWPGALISGGALVALLLAGGLVGLPVGAEFLVDGAVGVARDIGVTEAVIGLTVVAAGTSLPELATTLMAALRREGGVALGNVLGSNIYNILDLLPRCLRICGKGWSFAIRMLGKLLSSRSSTL